MDSYHLPCQDFSICCQLENQPYTFKFWLPNILFQDKFKSIVAHKFNGWIRDDRLVIKLPSSNSTCILGSECEEMLPWDPLYIKRSHQKSSVKHLLKFQSLLSACEEDMHHNSLFLMFGDKGCCMYWLSPTQHIKKLPTSTHWRYCIALVTGIYLSIIVFRHSSTHYMVYASPSLHDK